MSKRRKGVRTGQNGLGFSEHAWEQDSDIITDNKAVGLFPPVEIPRTRTPSTREDVEVSYYRALRQVAHNDPFFTIPMHNEGNNKYKVSSANAQVNPFASMPTYSQKYKKEQRTLPRLDTRPYVKEFFPEELRSLLEPKRHSLQCKKRKKPSVKQRLDQLPVDEDDAEQILAGDVQDDENMNKDEDEDEEVRDTDFERDEDEFDDYNAEIYFEDGEQDYDDDIDVGDGGDNY